MLSRRLTYGPISLGVIGSVGGGGRLMRVGCPDMIVVVIFRGLQRSSVNKEDVFLRRASNGILILWSLAVEERLAELQKQSDLCEGRVQVLAHVIPAAHVNAAFVGAEEHLKHG